MKSPIRPTSTVKVCRVILTTESACVGCGCSHAPGLEYAIPRVQLSIQFCKTCESDMRMQSKVARRSARLLAHGVQP